MDPTPIVTWPGDQRNRCRLRSTGASERTRAIERLDGGGRAETFGEEMGSRTESGPGQRDDLGAVLPGAKLIVTDGKSRTQEWGTDEVQDGTLSVRTARRRSASGFKLAAEGMKNMIRASSPTRIGRPSSRPHGEHPIRFVLGGKRGWESY